MRSGGTDRARRRFGGHPGVLLGLAGILVLGATFCMRSADPAIADPAAAAALRGSLDAQEAALGEALGRLRGAIAASIAEARGGAARTLAGSEAPGPHFEAAAARLTRAEPLLRAAQRAINVLAGLLAEEGGRPAPRLALRTGGLAASGAQLAAVGGAADAFVGMRQATQATLGRLGDALAAVDANDPAATMAALDAADAQLAIVRAWPGTLASLPIWTDTTGRLLDALRALAEARAAHDVAAARRAAAAYAAAAEEGHRADLALAVALAEGGSAVSAGAMSSAADDLAAVDAAQRALDDLH